jgi:hypothetical protein
MAIWLLSSNKNGIASTLLAKYIGVPQKTSWFMLHHLRYAATTNPFDARFRGLVEMDEPFVGSKERSKHASERKVYKCAKAVVFGMLPHGGECCVVKVPHLKLRNIKDIILAHVANGSAVMTDQPSVSCRTLRGVLPSVSEPACKRVRSQGLRPYQWN